MNRLWPFINPFTDPASDVPLLREAFVDWKIGYGIFEALSSIGVDLPWGSSVDSTILDIEYFGNRSGGKFVAPVIMNLLGDEVELTESDRMLLARIIWTKFGEPWKHLWETNVAAYNPIHNYDMTDIRTLVRENVEKGDDTRNSVDTTQHGRTSDIDDFSYGMNSDQDGPGRRDTRSHSKEGGDTTNVGITSNENNKKSDMDEVEVTQRAGNIGVTTTQQMLKSERELWLWNYFDQVYKDIDSVLALAVYDVCRI